MLAARYGNSLAENRIGILKALRVLQLLLRMASGFLPVIRIGIIAVFHEGQRLLAVSLRRGLDKINAEIRAVTKQHHDDDNDKRGHHQANGGYNDLLFHGASPILLLR